MGGFIRSMMRGPLVVVFSCCWILAAEPEKKKDDPTVKAEISVPVEKTVEELAITAKKSVVVVTFSGRDGQRQGLGTGFIISKDGLIATNLHVIGEARPIQVELHDRRKFDVTAVYATERSQDLALLKIDADDLPVLVLGNSDDLKVGQSVVAIGNPLGLERSVVSGILSGRREIEGREMLQIAVPIERGNSGGPVLDLQGKVHGLLTLKDLQTKNLGFAIASNAIKPMLQKPNPIPMSRWLTIGALDPDEWTVLPGGRWRQRSGQIMVDGRGGGFGGRALCLANEQTPEVPFEVAVQVKFSPSDGAAGLAFHADGGDKHFGFYPSNGSLRLSRFDGPDVYSWAVLNEVRSPLLKKEGWNSLKVRIESERMLCYLNGELVIESNDSSFKSGKVGLCKFRQTEAEFKNFEIGKIITDPRTDGALVKLVTSTIGELPTNRALDSKTIERLSQESRSVIQELEQQAKSLEDRAANVRRLAAEVNTAQTLAELKNVIADDSIDLFRAALLVAKLDNAELAIDDYIQDAERHARRIKSGIPEGLTEDERLSALNRYLFEEQGFHGSRTDYGNRSNSYINEVMDDREGLPITLSVLYMEIAKRIGINVVAVGMPSHFLVRHEPKLGEKQLIDVFDRGRRLTPGDARKLYEGLTDSPWQDIYLRTYPSTATLIRIVRNLLNVAAEAQDTDRVLRYTEAVLVIAPDSAHDHFIRAIVCYQTQRWNSARQEIDWLTSNASDIDPEKINELSRRISQESNP